MVAWGLALSATAAAATVSTDRSCYLEDRQVLVRGTGFAPGATYTVLRDGQPAGSGVVGQDGTVAGMLSSGALEEGIAERTEALEVSDGMTSADAAFRVTKFFAGFAPTRGDPATLRVRFSIFGFGAPALDVYVHYIRPNGRAARSVRLGRTTGPCGKIARTRMRRLFPFRPSAGRWHLQFDTHRPYLPHARPRVVREVDIRRPKRRR